MMFERQKSAAFDWSGLDLGRQVPKNIESVQDATAAHVESCEFVFEKDVAKARVAAPRQEIVLCDFWFQSVMMPMIIAALLLIAVGFLWCLLHFPFFGGFPRC